MNQNHRLTRKGHRMPVTKTILITKFVVVFLMFANFCAYAKSFAQTISISQQNTSLEKVFREIHRKTGYQFFYKDELLKQAKRFSIDVKNASVEEVLEICFRNQPLTYVITQKAITIIRKEDHKFVNGPPDAPPIVVTGKVRDEKGVALPGVSVSVIGSKAGVTTDVEGNFSITVPENSIISFTFIGFKTENIRVGRENATLEVALTHQVEALTDVVVVG